jgi:hypothetical protein
MAMTQQGPERHTHLQLLSKLLQQQICVIRLGAVLLLLVHPQQLLVYRIEE